MSVVGSIPMHFRQASGNHAPPVRALYNVRYRACHSWGVGNQDAKANISNKIKRGKICLEG